MFLYTEQKAFGSFEDAIKLKKKTTTTVDDVKILK